MASIRGKKRQEYIQRWLNGDEDPEVEVMPTRVEGKYIVRPRGSNQSQEEPVEPPQDNQANSISNGDNSPEDSSSYYSEYEEEEIPEPVTPKRKGKKINQNDIQLEILHQLRIMGEEAIRKREKKERKREMKHVVRKEMSRQDRYYDYDSDSDDCLQPQGYTPHHYTQAGAAFTHCAARPCGAAVAPEVTAPMQRYPTTPQQAIYPRPPPHGTAGPSYKRRTLNLLSDYR